MAKGNRAGSGDGEKGTHQIRVNADVGEMISWIIRIEGGTTAVLLDPMIRAQITARYKRHEAAIDKIRAAEEVLQKVEEEAKSQVTQDESAPAKGRRRRPE